MVLRKGAKFSNGYATVIEEDGVNYREISDIMTDIGFTMNHSSARNYILRIMQKFALAFNEEWDLDLSSEKIEDIARSPKFQSAIADVLHNLEFSRNFNNLA